MGVDSLAAKLLAVPGLQSRLASVVVEDVARQFGALTNGHVGLPTRDWDYLLTCASVLARSERGDCQDAALRIAHAAVTRPAADAGQKAAAAVILDMLSNAPALKLAQRRGLIPEDALSTLPAPLLLDKVARSIRYSVPDVNLVRLNRFQLSAYQAIESASWVSISAPTSAGKSHLLSKVVQDYFASSNGIAVYLVPTRALVQEVELRLGEGLRRRGLTGVRVSSVPAMSEVSDAGHLYVFTQERLHWLFAGHDDIAPDLLIVDEAQKISDGARGILLQSVIGEAVQRRPSVHVVFSSPMTENPGILLSQAPEGTSTLPVTAESVTVNQNLIWVSQVPRKPTRWVASLAVGNETRHLGEFGLRHRPTNQSKRLSFVAHALTHSTGEALVYVNTPYEAEVAAEQLYDLEGPAAETDLAVIKELVDLVKKTIHPKYLLAKVLTRRIAFHYGNMPLLIRSEIERLFRDGAIRFLVCTSTLLEGVNLPAKSIVLRTPQKGRNRPLSEVEFWNLAGRAGRQGMEFQGNVICIDPDRWSPPRTRRRYVIEPAAAALATSEAEQLLDYIRSGAPLETSVKRPDFEHAFVLLLRAVMSHGSVRDAPLARTLPAGFVEAADSVLHEIVRRIEIPPPVIRRNPGISPLAQQALLADFRTRSPNDAEELIPPPPESDDAADAYVRIIARIARTMSGEFQGTHWVHAVLVVNWMRGKPLAFLIAKNWEYWRKRGKNLGTVIRDTMREIEEYARFRFAKYAFAYTDVLRLYLAEVRPDLLDKVTDLNLMLEFGASQRTQLSLMDLGLSRTSAISVSELIASDSYSVADCRDWLLRADLDSLPLSAIVVAELARVRDALPTSAQ